MKQLSPINDWFASKEWTPWPFQKKAWRAYLKGEHGLIHVPTGSGKTYAALMGPLAELIDAIRKNKGQPIEGLQLLYVTPLRALTRDIEAAILRPIEELKLPITVDNRTGDSSSYRKAKQKQKLPNILITTPESLTILMSYPGAGAKFNSLKAVLADEWHELLGTKRGVQLELALARLRRWAPELRTWGLSATLGNLDEAAQAIVGVNNQASIVSANIKRPVRIQTLLPDSVDSFPWGGHIGIQLLPQVKALLEEPGSTLVFTNTRYQAERWYQELLKQCPDWITEIALHHGSLELETRRWVEGEVKSGKLRAVVCTSSLDLGVDFPAVERVIQIGSPHGLARLIQRAGRAKHRMGESSTIYCVPTHALELLEFSALREAYRAKALENRFRFEKPLDVLAQHLLSCALCEPFNVESLYQEVIQAYCYRDLEFREFQWVMALLEHGGSKLQAYPEYHKLSLNPTHHYEVTNPTTQRLHRMNIGTITSDASIQVNYINGATLGAVEEWFVSKLQAGDIFTFAGKTLEFIRIHEKAVYVRKSNKATTVIPRWAGGRLPLSESLGKELRSLIEQPNKTRQNPELKAAQPILTAQQQYSVLPQADELLIETCKTREGYHCFIFPFEGRLVHEGLASLWASALAQRQSASFSLSVSDYGLELLSKEPFPYRQLILEVIDSPPPTRNDLIDAVEASLNLNELAKRQFRAIARISGLVLQNYPGNYKTANQLQTSASLLYDVFKRYDPENLLLYQAKREVLEQLFELARLERTLLRLKSSRLVHQEVARPTPLGFPLMVERIASKLSSESLSDRVEKMKARWSKVKA